MRRTRTVRAGEIISEFFSRPYVARKIAEASLPEVWAEVAGPQMAELTRRVEFRRGVMTVWIDSSAARHMLFMNRTALRDAVNSKSSVPGLVSELIIK